MKILFVCMGDSIHAQRWVKQTSKANEIIALSVNQVNPKFIIKNNSLVIDPISQILPIPRLNTEFADYKPIHFTKILINLLREKIIHISLALTPSYLTDYLISTIKDFKPDIIHSLEFQRAGYLTLEAKSHFKGKFPKWIVSNWGSDIYLFGKDPEHKKKIHDLLKECDYYLCECQRDVQLANEYGLTDDRVLGVIPNAGGYDLTLTKYGKTPPSKRKSIMLKGYQGWAGRAMVGLQAIDKLGKYLAKNNYRLIIFSSSDSPEVEKYANNIADKYGFDLYIVPRNTSHEEIIKLHGESRISIGLSMGDGISTSLLESMLVGSFPIQSHTACADEWILDGKSGILVPPENVEKVYRALKQALTDDAMVDKAAKVNVRTIKERASYEGVRKQALALYNKVMLENKS